MGEAHGVRKEYKDRGVSFEPRDVASQDPRYFGQRNYRNPPGYYPGRFHASTDRRITGGEKSC